MQATVKQGSRTGRGFSLDELKEAGLNARIARKHGIPTDVWRSTKYEENVEALKASVKSIKETPTKEKKKPEEKPAAKRSKTVKKSSQKKSKKTAKKKPKKSKK